MHKKKEIRCGIYKHYKGGEYRVLFTGKNSENQHEVVVYQDLKDKNKVWVRPLDMFMEEVEIDGEKIKRFEFIREEDKSDFEDKYMRALADYQNLLKQKEKEKQELVKYANEQLIMEMLPVYDNLKTSMAHIDEASEKNGWAKGIEYVIRQFADALKAEGVEEVKTIGEKFDHNTMEAVSQEDTEESEKDQMVARELSAGYKLNGKIIKAARVSVYKLKD